jgi:subtilase family serine protease
VSVGGTAVTDSNGHVGYQVGWSLSGGGVSAAIPLPVYQQSYPGLASYSGRNVPDIAFPGAYAAMLLNGQWWSVSGTSWSCPQYVALQTLINHQLNQWCGRTNDAMYAQVWDDLWPSSFIDILDGNNGTYYCGYGYDNVTGIGVPMGYALGIWIDLWGGWYGNAQ